MIQRFTGRWVAAWAVVLVLAGCDVEMPDNGDLDGMWRLVAVDTLATGGHLVLGDEMRVWSVQNKLLELRDHTGPAGAFLLRFEHRDNQLRTYNPYVFNRETGDYPVENPAYMAPFGINELEEHFTVEQLSSSKMRLKNEELRLEFRKLN